MFRSLPIRACALAALLLPAGAAESAAPWRETRALLQSPGWVKVRTGDPLAAARLRAAGARLVAEHGAFQIFALPTELARSASPGWEFEDETLRLNAGPLRPAPASATRATEYSGRRLHVVQFAGPPRPEWLAALAATVVQIVCYLPQHAYLVYGESAAARQLPEVAGAQWQAEFAPAWKIARRPRKQATRREADWYAVQLVRDDAANAETFALLGQLDTPPPRRQTRVFRQYRNLVVRLTPAGVARLARQPEVVSIQPYAEPRRADERQALVVAGSLAQGVPLAPANGGPDYLGWLAARGFTQAQFDASGVLVDVSDSGLDNGTTSPNHFALYLGGQRPGVSRVGYARLEGTPNPGSTSQGRDGHGTLNAHIVAGYDASSGAGRADADGFRFGLGIAPFARVGSSTIFDPDDFTDPDFAGLQSRAYRDGARISSNSWGAPVAGAYTPDAQIYDALVRDAQPADAAVPAAGTQEMVIVFSAGNEGPVTQSITAPGTAKNVLTVGASEGVQAFGGVDGSGIGDAAADHADDLPDFTSRGPCADGRLKPDLVAPGTHISGGVWQAPLPGASGTADPAFSGTGISGGPVNLGDYPFWPAGQQFYAASSGTSHAAPAVAGAAALLRQHFLNAALTPPSPAMTKAYLLNAARALPADQIPSPLQGLGRLDLGRSFDGAPRVLRDQLAADVFTATGQVRKFVVEVANPTLPVRITLAWTDAPGSTVGAAYNNDLDLTVTSGAVTYLGNVLTGGASVSGGQPDRRNNHESVFLPAGVTGRVLVTITAANLNSPALPDRPGNAQDFALVVYNATPAPPTAFVVPTGITLLAESSTPANGRPDPGEEVAVALAVRNVGNATSPPLTASLASGGGVLQPSGAQSLPALAPEASTQGNFTFTAAPVCAPIQASFQLSDGASPPLVLPQTFATSAPNFILAESFDGVAAPALPAGWTSSASGAASPWSSSTVQSDSAPNAAAAADADDSGLTDLLSPAVAPQTASAVLAFRHRYDLDAYPGGAFDGAVLELRIGSADWIDASDAGGAFLLGGYDSNLFQLSDNPLSAAGARPVWALASPGFITTRYQLPASAAGQNVRFRWRVGTDSSNLDPFTGWAVDNITLQDGEACTQAFARLSLQTIAQTVAPAVAAPGTEIAFVVTVVHLGPQRATGVVLTDQLPAGCDFVSASVSAGSATRQGGVVTVQVERLEPGQSVTLTVVVRASAGAGALLTNAATVTAWQIEANAADNSSSASAHLDTDADGLPDDYELAHGFDPNDPADAMRDADGDGQSNLQEYLAGTDPRDAASALRIQQVTRSGADVIVRCSSAAGRSYRLERAAALNGPWTPVGPATAGTGAPLDLTDTGAAAGAAERFYRVRLQ